MGAPALSQSTKTSDFALMIVETLEGEESGFRETPTPVQGFLDALFEKLTHKERRTNRGVVCWCGYPIGHILGMGLIPLMEKVAEKKGWPYETVREAQQVQLVANPILSAGLVLTYESMNAAAEAFKREVLDAVSHMLTIGLRSGMELSVGAYMDYVEDGDDSTAREEIAEYDGSEVAFDEGGLLWQPAAAYFFSKLFVAAREKTEEIAERCAVIKRDNKINSSRGRVPLMMTESPKIMQFISEFDLYTSESADQNRTEASWRSELAYAETETKAMAERIRLFRRLPMNLHALPEELFSIDRYGSVAKGPDAVVDGWLTTHLLLAVTGHEADVAFLSPSAYLEAIQYIKSQNADKVMEMYLQRMRALNVPWSKRMEQELRRFGKMLIWRVCQWDSVIDIYAQSRAFVQITYDMLLIPERDAMHYILNDDVHLASTGAPEFNRQEEVFYQQVLEAVPWGKMTEDEVHRVIVAGTLKPVDLVKGLARVPYQVRETARDFFFQYTKIEEEVFVTMMQEKIFWLTTTLVGEYAKQIPVPQLEKWFLKTVDDRMQQTERTEHVMTVLGVMVKALRQIPTKRLRKFLQNVSHRRKITRVFFSEFYGVLVGDNKVVSKQEAVDLCVHIGRDLIQQFYLAYAIDMRQEAYPRQNKDHDTYYPRWESGHMMAYVDLEWEIIFPWLRFEEIQKLFKDHHEETVLAWIYEHESLEEFAERLERFEENRRLYYENVPPPPVTTD